MSHLLDQNLDNLDAFWSAIGYQKEGQLNVHKSWPNKTWSKSFRSEPSLFVKDKVFVTVDELYAESLTTLEVEIKTHLIAMSVLLASVDAELIEQIKVIESEQELEAWANACSKAFGYETDATALLPLLSDDNAEIFAYRVGGNIAGTAIAYQTNAVMGVHQVGVLPEYQGKGIGKLLMSHLVAYAKDKGCELMTLQASEAGLPIYVKMGFKKLGNVYHIGA